MAEGVNAANVHIRFTSRLKAVSATDHCDVRFNASAAPISLRLASFDDATKGLPVFVLPSPLACRDL